MSAGDIDTARRQRFVQGFLSHVPHMATLGIAYRGHTSDWVELEMPYAPELVAYPDTGVIASGAIYALMDSAAGMSVVLAMGTPGPIATLDLRLDYLHPALPGETVIARSTCYKLTRTIGFVRGFAYQEDEARPVANMAGTFMLPSAA
jgi:uncharacterized protein (TIGR00369 family)